jgi:serine/threonine-protein kinase
MSSPVSIGDVLAGKYQIERVLGVGGMGVVVAAKHLSLGERVAIKFLLPQALERPDVVARFHQEARAAAKLKSEHVARVNDTGTLESGAPYMVMEYLEGADIGAVLRAEGPLAIEVAVDYLLQACEALAEAHAAGIVHRDLKPGNLFLIHKNDGTPSIKIIDFGISKVGKTGDPPVDGTGEMTQTAVMMGSPLYMAPEQMASARDVDARADIWSLGVLLHCLLTGGPPFKGASVMQVYELIVLGAPPLRSLRPGAPEGLEKLLLRCLQKNRNERYENVAELAEALAPFGPAHARHSAERTARILQVQTRRESGPARSSAPAVAVALTPPSPVTDDKRSSDPALNKAEADSSLAGASASSIMAAPSRVADPSATDGPWNQKTSPPARRRKRLSMLLVGLFGTVAVGMVVLLALRSRDHRETAGVDTPALSALPVAASAAPSAPAILPGSAAPELASAPPPAEPAPSAAPVASAAAKPSGAPLAGVGPKIKGVVTSMPLGKPPPKKDLWGDRN